MKFVYDVKFILDMDLFRQQVPEANEYDNDRVFLTLLNFFKEEIFDSFGEEEDFITIQLTGRMEEIDNAN